MLRAAALALLLVLTACSAEPGDPNPTLVEPGEPSASPSRDPSNINPDPTTLRVLIAGDSITDAYFATRRSLGYPRQLVRRLADDHPDSRVVPVIVAVPGARAFRVAAAVEQQTGGARPFDVAVLEVGANDVGKSTLAEWTTGYQRLLDAVAATSPDATVVCLGPWNAPRPSRGFDRVVRRLCDDHVYRPLSDLYATPDLHGPAGVETELGTSDLFHPNDRGHAAMADRIAAALRGASTSTNPTSP